MNRRSFLKSVKKTETDFLAERSEVGAEWNRTHTQVRGLQTKWRIC